MGFLSDIGGMLPAAYAGFNKGVDDVTARQQREADAAYQQEQRDRERQMAPLEDEIRKKRLAAAGIKIDNEMELAPGQQERARQELAHLGKIDPLRRSTEEWNAIRESSDNKQKFIESAVPKLGEAIHTNNIAGVNVGVRNLFDAGLFKDVDGLQGVTAARSEIVAAPDGAVDLRGQPVKGRAIKVTLSDGRDGFIGTDYMLAQYAKQMQAADVASSKILKPGEIQVGGATGRVIAEGKEKAYGGGLVQDEDGNWVRIPGLGGAGGAGSRSGGKAPASQQSAAVGFFATAAEKAETKLTPTQIAYGQRLAEQIATQRSESGQPIPPAIAAEVAMEVALDPAKIQPQVNVQTGKIEGVFSRRDLGDVVVEPWSPALQRSFTPEQLGKAAEELVKAQPAAVREEFLAAAHDPAARKTLVEKVTQEIATKVPTEQVQAYTQSTLASLTEKLDIVSKNTKPPKANDSPRRSLFNIGGMAAPESYSPRAGVPDDLARRAAQANDAARQRATEQAARSAAESKASEERKAALEQEISWLTEAEVRAMSPSEAAGYLRKYESVLSSDLQRALRRRQ